MGTTSFASRTATTAPAESAPSAPAAQLAKVESTVALVPKDQFTGDWNHTDIRLPRINLVHKTSNSELVEKFGIGSFAFNKEVKLSDGKTPIKVTAVRALKDYIQKLPYGSPEMATVYSTAKEVEDNGGSFNYKDADAGIFYGERAHIQLAISAPEGATEEDLALFPYEFNGVNYAMAMLTVASSAYTSVGKGLATLCMNNKVMRQGMQYGVLNLTSEGRKNAKNSWAIPVITYAGANAPELVAFYESLLTN